MQTSVLTLLAEHTPKFKELLYKDNAKLLDFLVKMLGTVKNAALRNSICNALSALVLEVVANKFQIYCSKSVTDQ